MKQQKYDYLIIGGGISGISAAIQASSNSLEWALIEKSQELGGLTRSIYIGDYIFDYTGHFLHLSKFNSPSDISSNIDILDWKQIEKNAKCYFDGQMINAPFQYHVGELADSQKIKIYNEIVNLRKKNENDSSFEEYLVDNFGKTIAKSFLIPYNRKILSTSLNRISKHAVTRFFPIANKDLILKNIRFGNSKELEVYNSKFWYPKNDGIELLPRKLSEKLDTQRLLLNEEVLYVDLEKKEVHTANKKIIKYNKLISSMPLNLLIYKSSLKYHYEKYLKDDITAGTVLSFHLGIKGELPLLFQKVHWVYFSEIKYPFYRIGFYSNFNERMCLENRYSMYVEVGLNKTSKDIKSIFNKVLKSLEELNLVKKDNIEVAIYNFMNDGYVHYTHNREKIVNQVISELERSDVFCIGRYGKWQYSSMEDSIIEGYNVLKRVFNND